MRKFPNRELDIQVLQKFTYIYRFYDLNTLALKYLGANLLQSRERWKAELTTVTQEAAMSA